MAIPTLKSTYVLDVETAGTLDRIARDWQVSKSEALRRLIRSAGSVSATDRVTRFRQLQEAVHLTGSKAAAWTSSVQAERRASDRHRGPRRR